LRAALKGIGQAWIAGRRFASASAFFVEGAAVGRRVGVVAVAVAERVTGAGPAVLVVVAVPAIVSAFAPTAALDPPQAANGPSSRSAAVEASADLTAAMLRAVDVRGASGPTDAGWTSV
jgi:hypothetical protein